MRATLSSGIAAAAIALGVGAWLGARPRDEPTAPPAPEAVPASGFERVPVPEGVSGGAMHVAAHDPVRATCWGDGSVTIRRGEGVTRVTPADAGDRFRRVAVLDAGDVFALSSRGGLYDLSHSPLERIPVKGIQSGAAIGTDGFTLGIGGESGAFHRVAPLLARTSDQSFDDGDPSILAIAGLTPAFGFAVGRADGTCALSLGERYRLEGRFSGAVAAIGGEAWSGETAGNSWRRAVVAAGDVSGQILVWEVLEGGDLHLAPLDIPGRADSVGSPILAIVVERGPDSAARSTRWVVVHEPATVSLLRPGARPDRIELDSKPHGACRIDEGSAVLVATDAGERIVRFAR